MSVSGLSTAPFWTSTAEMIAVMKKDAAENTAVDSQADRGTGAVSTSSTPLDAVSSPSKATSATVVQTQAKATSLDKTSTYADGSPEQENVVQATGMAQSARNNIETLKMGVGAYNGAKKTLADTAELEKMRSIYGEEKTNSFIKAMKRVMNLGVTLMSSAQGLMREQFKVTGTVVTQTESGEYQQGQYTQSASGNGWSVTVKSTGAAGAIANGVDVSDQISDSSGTGFSWAKVVAANEAKPGAKAESYV